MRNNALKIIITIIIALAVIIGATITALSLFSVDLNVHLPFEVSTDADDSYITGGAELDTNGIESIEISWIDGNIDIEYYDGDKIAFVENNPNGSKEMCYKVDKRTLNICEYNGAVKNGLSNLKSKDLTVKLPNGLALDELNFEIVSANVNASDLVANLIDIEVVSGASDISLAKQPKKIDIESVSANVNIHMPKDLTGYTVEKESVSGSFRANDFDNKTQFGDGYTRIDFESVSGNLNLSKD